MFIFVVAYMNMINDVGNLDVKTQFERTFDELFLADYINMPMNNSV